MLWSAEQQTDTTTDTVASLSIEILDTPSFIQAESYRSCAHLYHHLHEQLLRYVDVGKHIQCSVYSCIVVTV